MEVEKVNEYTWRISKYGEMKVPATIYASGKLMEKIKQDQTLKQAVNVAKLPGIIKHSLVMPDAHQGFVS